ncbi:M23 family metallopeptidase [Tsuneonella mangrovi]|uniref:M23 family metallopeptidase n=1 Tax=Tsuneonella mangrovi TaxID=1982042 RepID=UPI001F0A571D|nr:M23 family metallopeptidase [Tsuneonella mangrovi]
MFTTHGQDAEGHGPADGAPSWRTAALTHSQIVPDTSSAILRRTRSFAEKWDALRLTASERIERIDLAPDLALNIGSRRWLRGFATFLGLSAASLAFWPSFAPLEAAPATNVTDPVRDEFRSQMIMPLALGGDSGRHMGATAFVTPLQSAPERPQIELLATLAQGDSFGRMLQRAGVGSADAARVEDLVSRTLPLNQITSGTQFDITLGRRPAPDSPRPLSALDFRARFDLALSIERSPEGNLSLVRKPIRVDDTPLRIRGRVGSSLYRSMRAAGAPASAVQQYLKTLGEQVNLDSGVRASDTFDMIVDYQRAATGERQAGKLIYAGLDRGGKPKVELMRWGSDGRYYEASGVGEQRAGLLRPVPGEITSGYGMRRHPILGIVRMHRGIDFHASYGQPIEAVADGRVESAGRAGGCGNAVKLRHAAGLETRYCHMSQMVVRPGQSVRRGQVIGYVGSTGLATGPHLHYEMYRNGQSINPASVSYVTRALLSGKELLQFRSVLSQIKEVEPGAALAPLTPTAGEAKSAEPEREIDRLDQANRLKAIGGGN